MKRVVQLSLAVLVAVAGVNMISGCGAKDDKALETAAPPPSDKGHVEPPMDKPNRPGAVGVGGGGGAATPAASGPGSAVN